MTKCKCAAIRNDVNKKCPFGLSITSACEFAGNSVNYMCPLDNISDEELQKIKEANLRIYAYYKNDCRCLYAANILKDKNVVNCDYGEALAGMHVPAFQGSPLYAQSFAGASLTGLYAFPLGYYTDNATSRNLFYGLFSLVGSVINRLKK